MAEIGLSLIVIKSSDAQKLRDLYQKLGLKFQQEQHSGGPIHFSCVLSGTVLEIYPIREGENPTLNRLGFVVPDIQLIISRIEETGFIVVSKPKLTQWGYVAVLKDFEGRILEVTQN